jgi:hypothetical protein
LVLLDASFVANVVFHDKILVGQMVSIAVHFAWRFFLIFGTFVRRKDLADGNTAEQLDFQRVCMGVDLVTLPNVQTCTPVSLGFVQNLEREQVYGQ